MNTPKILHNTLSVIIYLILTVFVIGLIFTTLSIMGIDNSFVDLTSYQKLQAYTPDIYIFMLFNLCVYVTFFYGLLQFKKAAKLLMKSNFYDIQLSKYIEATGKCFVISGVFWWFFDGIASIHFDNKFSLGLSEKTFIYLFIIAIGLFMMLMSTILNKTRALKEQNDLTI